jgi:catechol 2,3-dioxygenase-like lactoylglutathione lyase family enzyme
MFDHIGINVSDYDRSRDFYARALAPLGYSLLMEPAPRIGGPGIREIYHPTYYGAFVRDPDGNNVEAVCHRPE